MYDNPIIEAAREKFDALLIKLFTKVVAVGKPQMGRLGTDDWNKLAAPTLREIKKIITG